MTDLQNALGTVLADARTLLGLTRDQATTKTRIDQLRREVQEELAGLSALTGANVPITVDGLGTVTYEREGKPEPVVVDAAALAEHLAQHRPSAVRATIEVPADALDEVLSVLTYSRFDVKARVEATTAGQASYLAECEHHVIEGRDEFLHQAQDGEVTTVPGLAMKPRAARIVVRAAKPTQEDES